MFATSDFRKGLKIEFKGDPYEIIDFQHVKRKGRRKRQDKHEES